MASATSSAPPNFAAIIANHVGRYPRLELQDLYKLCHQSSLGSGHAVPDAAMARQWLVNEASQMGDGPEEPLFDPISPDGAIVRVHLRTYVASGGGIDLLAGVFVRTANEFPGSLSNLKARWACVEDMVLSGQLPFPEAEVRHVSNQVEAMGYGAVHHSDAFNAAYRPAYRVVATPFLVEAVEAVKAGQGG